MNLINQFKTCLFFTLLCFLVSVSVYAYAPSSLTGKKISFTIPDADSGRTYENDNYFTDSSHAWQFEYQNGDWESKKYVWSSSGTSGTLKWGEFPSGGWSMVANVTFTSASSGITSFTEYELNESGNLEVDYEGTASFTMNDYSSQELPPFENYFSDDFSNSSQSSNYWYDNIETSWNGLSVKKDSGKLDLTGNANDPEELYFDVNSKSLLPVSKSWVIDADLFSTLPGSTDETWHVKVGFEIEDSLTDIEFMIGPYNWGVHSGITFENATDWVHLSSATVFIENGSFRIRNDATAKTFYSEYFDELSQTWVTHISLNWETGIVSGATYSTNSNTSEIPNWPNLENYYLQPCLDFKVPHTNNGDSVEVRNLSSGELGSTRFSVTEGAPEPDPEYAPSSLVGKIYQGSDNDHYQFLDTSKAIFYHKESNFQESEISEITYTWTESGNTGTLTTSLDEITTLTFSSETEGSSVRQEEGSNNTSSGTFSLADSSAGNAPDDLSGDTMIFGTSTYIFKDNGVVTIRTTTGSEESTYGYVKSNNDAGTLSIPAQTDNASSTLYRMSFSSSSSGTLSEGGSGSFEYFIDGSNQPSSKGWMWFDQYPWVYSEIEQGWIYFYPSGSKLLAFSDKDQAWREME